LMGREAAGANEGSTLLATAAADVGIGLPPMPEPSHAVRSWAAVLSTAVICAIIAVCVSAVSAVCFATGDLLPTALRWTLFGMVFGEAVVALICLAAILSMEPTVLARERMQTLPDEIAKSLSAGTPLPGENVVDAQGRVFCVRCMLWRPDAPAATPHVHAGADGCGQCSGNSGGTSVHHCSVCQRCVVDFSHHCVFFQRCFGGRGLRGNLKYLVLIKVAGVAAVVTVLAAVMTQASLDSRNASRVSPYVVVEFALVSLVVVGLATGCVDLLLVLLRFAVLRRCRWLSWEADPPKLPPEPVDAIVCSFCGCGPRSIKC